MKRFTDSHHWITIEGDVGTVGITNYAQSQLGEIVYIEFPKIGTEIKEGDEAFIVESTKAATDICAPLSGKVLEINTTLSDQIELLNTSPEERGWIFKIQITNPDEVQHLLDHPVA